MAEHTAEVFWERGDALFVDNRYSRRHWLRFDGGAEVAGSASPHVVPLPLSDAAAVDPEEAFVAALSSCHMLWFLAIAAARAYRVDSYLDQAVGVLGQDADGKQAMTRVTLRPRVAFSGDKLPDRLALDAMHHAAHAACFIASSVKSEVLCQADYTAPGVIE